MKTPSKTPYEMRVFEGDFYLMKRFNRKTFLIFKKIQC